MSYKCHNDKMPFGFEWIKMRKFICLTLKHKYYRFK